MKVLYWDMNGFCLWLKKLETDRFPFPDSGEVAMELDLQKLNWLLNGIDFRREHKEFRISKTV